MLDHEAPSFAVVIPAYNEEAGIQACVAAVDAVLALLPNRTTIIVVDDGSADATAQRLTEIQTRYPRLTVEQHSVNHGYGVALRTGTLAADRRGLEYVVFMDSDLTNNPAYLRDFALRMGDGFDVIKASRYVPGGRVDGVPVWRTALSRLGNHVAHALFGIPVRDCTNGFRAVRTRLLTAVELHETGFAVIMEELYRLRPIAKGYAEVPIVLTSRAEHLRPSSFTFGPRALFAYLKYPALSATHRRR